MRAEHGFPSFFVPDSSILILGSFPSVKSREESFYYANKTNRFWKVLGGVFDEPEPSGLEEKKAFLIRHHLALSDSIYACDIRGSADSSIANVVPMDLDEIFELANIRKVIFNGKAAERCYYAYQKERKGIVFLTCPSTSAANAAWRLESLVEQYRSALTE